MSAETCCFQRGDVVRIKATGAEAVVSWFCDRANPSDTCHPVVGLRGDDGLYRPEELEFVCGAPVPAVPVEIVAQETEGARPADEHEVLGLSAKDPAQAAAALKEYLDAHPDVRRVLDLSRTAALRAIIGGTRARG